MELLIDDDLLSGAVDPDDEVYPRPAESDIRGVQVREFQGVDLGDCASRLPDPVIAVASRVDEGVIAFTGVDPVIPFSGVDHVIQIRRHQAVAAVRPPEPGFLLNALLAPFRAIRKTDLVKAQPRNCVELLIDDDLLACAVDPDDEVVTGAAECDILGIQIRQFQNVDFR